MKPQPRRACAPARAAAYMSAPCLFFTSGFPLLYSFTTGFTTGFTEALPAEGRALNTCS